MVITPNASPETPNSRAQQAAANLASLNARRNSGTGVPAFVGESAEPGGTRVSEPETAGLNATGADALNSEPEINDASGADSIMHSLRAAMLAQPGSVMAGQANLSPQSVLGLLG
jgi:hypothetical protein